MKPSSDSWRNVIWQEWLHTEDTEYIAPLFNLVADKLPGAWQLIAMAKGVGYGLLVGLFLWVLGMEARKPDSSLYSLLLYLGVGAGLGGLVFGLFIESLFTQFYTDPAPYVWPGGFKGELVILFRQPCYNQK